MLGTELSPKETPLGKGAWHVCSSGQWVGCPLHPARGARIRSIGRNLHQRISHLAVGLDPSQVRLNLVAGAGFVCSGETMVWKPFFLPS